MASVDAPRAARAFGIANLVAATVVAFGVFVGLPARWWPVDAGGAFVAVLLALAGAGLVTKKAWAERAARVAALVVLVIGLAFVATLAMTASYLSGIYGAVGRGGAVILVLVAALVVPYVVALPALQLAWLGPRASAAKPAASAAKPAASAAKPAASAASDAKPSDAKPVAAEES